MRTRIYLLPNPFRRRKVPMELGAIDAWGIMRIKASSKVVIPCSRISWLLMTCTGVAVLFSRWWWPEPVTTTGFRLYVRLTIDESRRSIWWIWAKVALPERSATNRVTIVFKVMMFYYSSGAVVGVDIASSVPSLLIAAWVWFIHSLRIALRSAKPGIYSSPLLYCFQHASLKFVS